MHFLDQLTTITKLNNSLLCVGLDSDLDKIPAHLKDGADPLFAFNRSIIDATHDLVCTYKLQIAFYSACAKEHELEQTITYIHKNYPQIPVILDAKRGDIGNTAECYTKEVFDRYRADAVTLSPFLGTDSLQPFLDRKEKGCIILCRNSNPGAKDFQDLKIDGHPLYWHIAMKAAKEWNKNNNVLLVVGATVPKELAEIRQITGDMTFLVPGIGAQGGDIETTIRSGINSHGAGMIINSSRAIIYASKEKDFANGAREVAKQTRDQINQFRSVGSPH